MNVDSKQGFRLWAANYDSGPNPVLALERRILMDRLGPLTGRRVLDVATGTGFWASYARSLGAEAFGLDQSCEMLAVASGKPGLSGRLVAGDMSRLPFRTATADFAICSFAAGYLHSVAGLIQELARVARTLILSDLHECALSNGWKRSFEADGKRIELAHFSHSSGELDAAARSARLSRQWSVEACFGEQERHIFTRAGREHAFEAAARIPAVAITCWSR